MLARLAWDVKKEAANLRKHRVSFSQASEVFLDPLAGTVLDLRHDVAERRYFTIGVTRDGKLLSVGHTDKEHEIRIISALPAMQKERRHYQDG